MVPFLCIGIPARNEEASIERCIRNITKTKTWGETPPQERELVVCVNGSTDTTAKICRRLVAAKEPALQGLRVIEIREAGKNKAINTIVANSNPRTALIYISDADVLVKRDTIGKVLHALQVDRKIAFASSVLVPSAAYVHPKKRNPTQAL